MNKKGFASIIVIGIAVAILLGIAAYFFFTRQNIEQELSAPRSNSEEDLTPESSPSQIDTSSWKTYQLAHPSFPHWEIKFPQTFRCPESRVYPCSRTSVPVAGVRIDENGKVILSENSGATSLTLCTEDFVNAATPPATYCISVETSKKWSSSGDFFSYIQSQVGNPEEAAKQQKRGISILKVNDPVMINGSTVVKVEMKAEGINIDRYFIEKDSENFLRISVAKHKLSEAQKRAAEIDAIIASFKFTN